MLAQARVRHPALNRHLRNVLAGTDPRAGALFSRPVIEGAAAYLSSGRTLADLAGKLLHPSTVAALTSGDADAPYRFTHPAYKHQLDSWCALSGEDKRSVLVSSGTGSGKTECFLVPMIDDLAREAEQKGRLTGVRALLLYPLNALIASQEERLSRWIEPFKGTLRFGLYNGLMTDRRRRDADAEEAATPWQVRYRSTLRADPPPVLVTNNTMLEYMTIRREDAPMVEASQGKLRWIVIDEAHSYIGTAAAEVSLLLRRVLQTFGVRAENVRFVATSATIGGDSPEERARLGRYLADLAGVSPDRVEVVFGARADLRLPPVGSAGRLEGACDTRLSSHPAVQGFVRAAHAGPRSDEDIARSAHAVGLTTRELLEGLAAATDDRGGPLLPLRTHQFLRAVPGLWSCLNADCSGPKPDDWPLGALHHERLDHCTHCRAHLFELVSCRECGEPWLNARDDGERLTPLPADLSHDEFAATEAREGAMEVEAEEGELQSDRPRLADRRLIATRMVTGVSECDVNPLTGALLAKRGEGQAVGLSVVLEEGRCPHCHAAGGLGRPSPLWPFRFGAPFLMQNAVPTLLEGVSPAERGDSRLPADGRQILSFTDSRQGTARLAANIETSAERAYVRAFAFHSVQRIEDSGPGEEERREIGGRIAKLRPLAAGDPSFAAMLAEQEAKLRVPTIPTPKPWTKVESALASDPMVARWIRDVWHERGRDGRYANPEALARFLLLRELARRPRRANSLETLGLVQLRFSPLEAHSDTRTPSAFTERGRTATDWRDLLYFFVDSVLRTNFVLDIARDDARWLLPRQAHLRAIIGPGQEKNYPTDQTWPSAKANGKTKTNAVRALESGLKLDSSSAEDRSVINDVLQAAWDQLRPLVTGLGNTQALDLTEAELAPIASAWLCPVTERVLPRLLFGRSPYGLRHNPPGADQPPMPLAFPTLPLVFPADDEQRDNLRVWSAADPKVEALRRQGVWGALHDRAATFAPYIRSEEHSAQQPPHRLREFERQFKAGQINLLACSTTMEMGVDIGSIEAVLNTNVPPSIANYRQRVGRAGRRGQPFTSSLTYARDTPLDREAFASPVDYLNRTLSAPMVKLDSARVVQRHANALLLARWFAQAGGELNRMKAGAFYGCPESLTLAEDPALADEFAEWLRRPGTAAAMADGLARLLHGTALALRDDVIERTAVAVEVARAAFGETWRALRQQATGLTNDARKSVELQMRRMCREPLLRELANRSFLPGHGFPTSVVPLITDCAELRQADRAEREEGETSRNRRYDYPSRSAEVAIREYAPGNDVVVDGLVWTSAGVTLNWQRPAHDEAAREVQSLRWAWHCRDCRESGSDGQWADACAACGSDQLERRQFLEPAGFRVDWWAEPHAQTDQVTYVEPEAASVSTRGARWQPFMQPLLGRVRATSDGLVLHMSGGAERQGYRICLDCGRAAEARDGALAEHQALVPVKGESGRCPGNDKTYAIAGPLALGHEVLTDVVEFQPVDLTDPGAAWALASALRGALARQLGIEPREMGLAVEPRPGALAEATHSIFLFDAASGGAGYAPRLLDDLVGTLQAAREVLDCPVPCDRACSACVLTADLWAQAEIADRLAAAAVLDRVLTGLAEPDETDQVGPGSRLSPPVADALVRRIRAGDVVTLFLAEGFDLASLDRAPLGPLFARARTLGVVPRLALRSDVLDAMDPASRAGLRNASHRLGYIIATAAPPIAANGARLLAEWRRGGAATGFWSRSAEASVPGAVWGEGADHPIIEAALTADSQMRLVPEDELERSAEGGDRVLLLPPEGARPLRQFGASLSVRLRPELEAAGLWRPGELKALDYADRYLASPLTWLLLLQTASAFRKALGPADGPLPLAVHTQSLRDDRGFGWGRELHHDWRDEDVRADVAEALADALSLDLTLNTGLQAHGRKLTLRWADGTASAILLDQGFGWWRTAGRAEHDFRPGANSQVRALMQASAMIQGEGDSYLALVRHAQ